MKELVNKIPAELFFFPFSNLCLSPPCFSSLNRVFISSKQGNVNHQLKDVLSLQVSLCIFLQGRNSVSELQMATGLMLFSQSWASLANCLGELATQPLNPENGLIIPFAFLFELPALQQQSQPEKEQKRGWKALAPAQAPGQLFCGPSIALLTRAMVAQIQYDWVHAGCSQVRRRPSYFF